MEWREERGEGRVESREWRVNCFRHVLCLS